MDIEKATAQAREYLCRKIEISHCPTPLDTTCFYNFSPDREHLFTFKLFGHTSVGASEYIAVDRNSGEIRYLGFSGE